MERTRGNRNRQPGWNNKLRHLVGHQHPTIWKLIKVFQMEQAYTETVVAQLQIRGAPQTARTKRVHTELQARLQRLCVSFLAQERNLDN